MQQFIMKEERLVSFLLLDVLSLMTLAFNFLISSRIIASSFSVCPDSYCVNLAEIPFGSFDSFVPPLFDFRDFLCTLDMFFFEFQ